MGSKIGGHFVTGPAGNLSEPAVRNQLRSLFGAYWAYPHSQAYTLRPTNLGELKNQKPLASSLLGGVVIPTGVNSQTVAVWGARNNPPAVVLNNNSIFLGWRWGSDAVANLALDSAWLETALQRYGINRSSSNNTIAPYCQGSSTIVNNINNTPTAISRSERVAIAPRRPLPQISENTGKGVVCYISNYSWVSEPSFVVLRQNLLKNFNKFWIENMHGNRKISEYAPDGRTSETIFSIPGFSAGIQQGVVISLWLKNSSQQGTKVLFRDDIDAAKAVERRSQLLESLNNQDFDSLYQVSNPEQSNRYSFRPSDVSSHYLAWPKLTDLSCQDSSLIIPLQGMDEDRANALIDCDQDILSLRMQKYFDKTTDWDEFLTLKTGLSRDSASFDAKTVRKKAHQLDSFKENNLKRYNFRPYDTRWCYITLAPNVWKRVRPDLYVQYTHKNLFLLSRSKGVAQPEGIPFLFTQSLFARDCMRGHAVAFPMLIYPSAKHEAKKQDKLFNVESYTTVKTKANLSEKSRQYLNELGINNIDENIENASLIWLHSLAIGYSPLYLGENADGIRQDFPRIPLPNSQELLIKSAQIGQAIASLLDTENPVIGVTKKPTPALQKIALISCTDGGNLNPDKGDLIINVGWGHGGKNGVTMPGKGKAIARQYTTAEMSVISPEMRKLLGTTTYDIYLNDRAYWPRVYVTENSDSQNQGQQQGFH